MFRSNMLLQFVAGSLRTINRGVSARVIARQPGAVLSQVVRRYSEFPEEAEKLSKTRPSNFEKKILVYSNIYPSIDQVPEKVSYQKLKKAKDWFRIRLNIGMALATVIGCFTMIYAGKKEHNWGDSITKQNKEWHAQVKKQAHPEQAS